MQKRRNQVCGLIILLIAGCSGISAQNKCSDTSAKCQTITVTDKDNDGKITLKPGDRLIIKLEMRAGTGYNWEIAKNDSARLMPIGEPTVESPEEVPGAVEYQIFQFKAKATGACVVELHYLRPWEKDVEPLKKFKLAVQIG
ncbi:MAG: protease inhibitor I42 family protein [Acidobacteriota bacterium]